MVTTEDHQQEAVKELEQTPAEPFLPSNVVLKLDHVSKSFGSTEAVRDLSLEVHRGEMLTLLGPSRCGKTTTLRMVVGLERVSEGEILCGGRAVDSPVRRLFVPVHKRNVGMVFQSGALWPHMTVFENVAYPLRTRGVDGTEVLERVGQALEDVGLSGYDQRPATTLSGVQQQRVALARSLVFEPEVLLLDEPFSKMDAKHRESMRAEVRMLQRRLGLAVVLATDDPPEALCVSDRIAVMNQGQVEQVGPPLDLYRRPTTPAVRDLLGKTISFQGQVIRRGGAAGVTVQLQDESGPLLTAQAPGVFDWSMVDRCEVSIRPEAIEVGPAAAGGGGASTNTLPARFEALFFTGDHFEAAVRLPWGQTIVVYLPSSGEWRQGDELAVHLPEDQISIWPV